jgi:sec-independent protein translocase protein TatA
MLVPSVPELLVILGIVVVIFGGAKLPKLGGDVAQAIKNFKEGLGKDEVPASPAAKQIGDRPDRPQA